MTLGFFKDLFSGGMLAIALVSFAVLAGVFYFVFRMLKKSVKMAFRLAVVVAVMIILAAGAFSMWWFGSGFFDQPKDKPPARRSR